MPTTRPNTRHHPASDERGRPEPFDADGVVGRSLAARYAPVADAALPERLAELLDRLDVRAATERAR